MDHELAIAQNLLPARLQMAFTLGFHIILACFRCRRVSRVSSDRREFGRRDLPKMMQLSGLADEIATAKRMSQRASMVGGWVPALRLG